MTNFYFLLVMTVCKVWKLKVNINKSIIMVNISSEQNLKNKFQFNLSQNQLESVNSFNYLGVVFQLNGKFKATTTKLGHKAQKALFKIYKMLWDSNTCYSVSLACKLFDSLVKPILLYSSDVWGSSLINMFKGSGNSKSHITDHQFLSKLFDNTKFPFEQLHIKFCKRTLGVHRKASNVACRGELGQYPLTIDMCNMVMKYYHRLVLKKTNNVILESAFQSNTRLKNDTWLAFIQKLLQVTNCTASDLQNKNFGDLFKEKIKLIYRNVWLGEINKQANNKLSTYKHFKTNFCKEKYLECISNRKHKIALTKFRISAHRLPIEAGRYRGLDKDVRFCHLCDNQQRGDERHVFKCEHKSVKTHRNRFMSTLFLYAPNLHNLSNDELFLTIFSSFDNYL